MASRALPPATKDEASALTADRWREVFGVFDAGLDLEPEARTGWLPSLDGDAVLAPWVETPLRLRAAGRVPGLTLKNEMAVSGR